MQFGSLKTPIILAMHLPSNYPNWVVLAKAWTCEKAHGAHRTHDTQSSENARVCHESVRAAWVYLQQAAQDFLAQVSTHSTHTQAC